MEASFILNSFRSIISVIDRAVYGLISFLYQILQLLAEKQIFSGDVIDSFATRVYTLLGLIMVFKVTFSLINYVVNPDLITDKTQGVGNIAKNIVITLVLIIITPYLFDFGYRLQGAILKDNILPRLILETDDTNSTSLEVKMDPVVCDGRSTYVDNYGDYMAMMTLRPFYQFDKTVLNRNRNDYIEDQYCKAKNTNDLLKSEIYKADEGISDQNNVGSYLIDYSLILSTVAGVIVALMLLTLCMDVAVRTIKLGFLEIVSPIPIISYIDPKSGKDGIFKKWYKEVFGTWLGLFVKLAAIYFAIYIISLVGQADLSSEEHGIWIMLFLIIGALMFAKQFTKLIEDIFGLKVDGLSLHPIKKIQDQALFGKQLLGAGTAVGVGTLGAVGAGAANVANNFKHKKDGKFTLGNNLKMAGSGLIYGAYHGIKNGYNTGKDGKFKLGQTAINSIQQASEDRNLNEALIEQGVSKAPFAKPRFMAIDKFTDVIGYQGKGGTTDELKERLKAINAQKLDIENQYKAAQETLSRYKANASDVFNNAINSLGIDPFKREYELENGHTKINSDGTIAFKPLQTFDQFKASSGITFKAGEEEQFKRDYEKMYNAEMSYRDAYNKMLELNKKETKLSGEQDKFKNAKNAAKK